MLFGKETIYGNSSLDTSDALSVPAFPLAKATSLIPAYERVPPEDMKLYLEKEMSFYLSQGCKYNCDFCQARKNLPEEYREGDVLKKDLNWLFTRAEQFGIPHLEMYLSNLDLFQRPHKLTQFADIVLDVRANHPEVTLGMRGLATVAEMDRQTRQPHAKAAVEQMVRAGLHTVGFGVDGWGAEHWEAVQKGHNTEETCMEAIRRTREEFGMTPEILMVFGDKNDTTENLEAAFNITEQMVLRHGAIPRPHVAKSLHWQSKDMRGRLKLLLENPEYFQAFDFTALPSALSHPDPKQRAQVRKNFIKMTQLPGNTTPLIYPYSPEFGDARNALHRLWNLWKFDR